MKVIEEIRHCERCNTKTLHKANKKEWNLILHFIMIILTGFIWLIFMGVYAMFKTKKLDWICTNCIEVIDYTK